MGLLLQILSNPVLIGLRLTDHRLHFRKPILETNIVLTEKAFLLMDANSSMGLFINIVAPRILSRIFTMSLEKILLLVNPS